MHTNIISTATTINLHLIGCLIVAGDGGSWSRRVCSRRWHSFGVGVVILVHLLSFLGVAQDNIAVTGRVKKASVEVTKELASDLFIP
jgi:hypothetical protein